MKISKFFIDKFLVIIALVMLLFSSFISNRNPRPSFFISKQNSSLNVNSKLTEVFHLGQKRLISSLLWMATILESDHDHYKKRDLNSWMYLRFKSISDLEPRFYENYLFGGQYLSIVKDDLPGASIIYDRGLKEYSEDFDLLKNAAFHFHFEVGDFEKSYLLYSKLRNHPKTTPLMLTTLARLENEKGNMEVAFELLQSQYAKILKINEFFAKKIFDYMYAIRSEIDLQCLNSKKNNCRRVDLNGNSYIYYNNKYIAKDFWVPFRPKNKKY